MLRFRTLRRVRAAGFVGSTSQSPLLTYLSIKSRLQGFALKLAARSIRDEGHEGSDSVGTLHVAHWVPFEHNHLGFFTIYDGSFEKYIQDFAEKLSPVFDAVFPATCRRARLRPRSQRTPRRSISGVWTTTILLSVSTAPIQASRCRTSGRSWPIASLSLPRPDTTGPPMFTNQERGRVHPWLRRVTHRQHRP